MFTSTVLSSSARAVAPVRPMLHLPTGGKRGRTTQPFQPSQHTRWQARDSDIDIRQQATRVRALTWQHWQQ